MGCKKITNAYILWGFPVGVNLLEEKGGNVYLRGMETP